MNTETLPETNAPALLHYTCARCSHEWFDDMAPEYGACDDDCPKCEARHMAPAIVEHACLDTLDTLSHAERFFYLAAGYSFNPKTETAEQGRTHCARQLARSEKAARDSSCSFHWEIDPDIDSRDFDDSPEPWQLWQCVARDNAGNIFASLHAIDFGHDGTPWDAPYRRVVEAELAGERP